MDTKETLRKFEDTENGSPSYWIGVVSANHAQGALVAALLRCVTEKQHRCAG